MARAKTVSGGDVGIVDVFNDRSAPRECAGVDMRSAGVVLIDRRRSSMYVEHVKIRREGTVAAVGA